MLELLIVLGILAILAVIVMLVINPADFLRRSRDIKRVNDLEILHHAISYAGGIDFNVNIGSSSVVYISLPDNSSSTCGSWGGLPVLPPGWEYHCVPDAVLTRVDGSGWVPINFRGLSTGSPLSSLPVDPVNASTSGFYYTYNTGSWRLTAALESDKYQYIAVNDGGIDTGLFEIGSSPAIAQGPDIPRGPHTPTPTATPTGTPTATPTPSLPPCTPDSWTKKADFGGTARNNAVGFAIGTKGYIGTGQTGGYEKDFWEYDSYADVWTKKTDFGGVGRYSAVGFSMNGKGYIGTGYSGAYKKDVWQYDPPSDVWASTSDFGGVARDTAVAFSISGMGYIGTGWNKRTDFWTYQPATSTPRNDFSGPGRYHAVAFSIGAKGYIGTGISATGYEKDFWEYDPTFDNWIQKADVGTTTRFAAVGFVIGNKGYIGTGGGYKDFWEYDPGGNTWTKKADFGGTARTFATGFAVNGRGYIGTGGDPGATRDFWEYCP